jgi:FtsH-binding integral membrane protein
MAVDVSGLSYFMPIFGFLFVFVIVYALLSKTKLLGESMFINLLISFIIAVIFATISSAQEYVEAVTPWFVVLIIALFFILILIGLSQQKINDIMKPGFVWVFIVALILVFLISAVKVFAFWQPIKEFVTAEGRIVGGILLLIIAALAAWVITRK